MNFHQISYALLLSAAVLAVSATAGAALPPAQSALPAAIDRIDLRSDVAAARKVTRTRNVTRNRTVNRTNVNVNVRKRVVVRPVRPWVARPWFGTVVAGVTLGTVIAATAAPPPPSANLCWFWSDSTNTRGYWDYCTPPR